MSIRDLRVGAHLHMSITGADTSGHALGREERPDTHAFKLCMVALAVFIVAVQLAWVVGLLLLGERLVSAVV